MSKIAIYTGRTDSNSAGSTNDNNIAVGEISIGGANAGDTRSVVRSVGVYSNLYLRVITNNTTGGSNTFSFYDNTVAQTQTVSIATGAGSVGEFEDTTHSDTVIAADVIHLRLVVGTGGTILTPVLGDAFAATTNTSCWIGSFNIGGGFSTASTTAYWRPTSTPVGGSVSETAPLQLKIRTAGTIKNAFIDLAADNRTTTTTFGNRHNSANGSMAISVPGSSSGQVEDTAHSDAYAAGDLHNVYETTGTGASTCGGLLCFVYETTDSSMQCVTTSNLAGGQAYSASTTYYEPLNGLLQGNASETGTQTKCGFACTASLHEVYSASVNGITATSTITFRKNAGAATGVISVGSGVTGWVDDTTHSDALISTDELDWQVVGGGSGTTMNLVFVGVKLVPPTATVAQPWTWVPTLGPVLAQ